MHLWAQYKIFGSLTTNEFLDYLNNCQELKEQSLLCRHTVSARLCLYNKLLSNRSVQHRFTYAHRNKHEQLLGEYRKSECK